MTIDSEAEGDGDTQNNLPSTSTSSILASLDEVQKSTTRDDLEDDVLDQDVPAPAAVTGNDEETPNSSSPDKDRVWKKTSKVPPHFVNSKFDKPYRISRSTKLNLSSPVRIFVQVLSSTLPFDQLHSTYSISWKRRRWWMRMLYYCVESCIVNSYILYKTTLNMSKHSVKPMTHLNFQSALASEPIAGYCGRKRPDLVPQTGRGGKKNNPQNRSTTLNAIRLNNVDLHLPTKETRLCCGYCSTKKKQRQLDIIYQECKLAISFGCFVPYYK
ncbi:hypothetical protein ILUMI_26769 [Ignelater luminosus]|uniref:PiggyBac transposable element-derived protein domain-containing protein n=1 Tax=Ignelater luminosus TaxID=2038154 RepID=A0A8K0C675_IGNLU|nr:hypothetical protein ILUMI_26769 [Ignelater luminosus]